MKKQYVGGMILSVFVVVGIVIFLMQNQLQNKKATTDSEKKVKTDNSIMTKNYSMAEIGRHNVDSDCWMAIDKKVYDLSAYVSSGKHPGGDQIKNGCGKDATNMFNTRGGKGPHNQKAQDNLNTFFLGNLR